MPIAPEFNRTGYNFLMTEADTGLAFSHFALDKLADADKVRRNSANARLAYDTLLRFRDRVTMSVEEAEAFETRIGVLRSNLCLLGQRI